jgi:hypothetical protein
MINIATIKRVPITHWVAAVFFAALLLVATMDWGLVVNGAVMLLIAACIATYLFHQLRYSREILFYSHIREDSWLQNWRKRTALPLIFAIVSGILLAVSLQVFLLTVPWMILLCIIPLQWLFFPLRFYWMRKLNPHLKSRSKMLLANTLSVVVLGLLSLVGLIVGKWLDLHFFINRELLLIPDDMADYVIARIEYTPLLIQHLARTLLMFELELLRAYTHAEGWFGTLILLYFLLPSTLAAFTLPALHAGVSIACRSETVTVTADESEPSSLSDY